MRSLVLVLLSLTVTVTQAADIGFSNITKSEFKAIIEEFSAGYSHTAVSGASSLGTIFGFEAGVVASATKSASIDKFSREIDASAEFDTLPGAAVFAAVTFPLGITGEINYLPEIKSSDVEFNTSSLAVKWTPTDIFPLPVELAVKFHLAMSDVTWKQVVSSQTATINYEQEVSGLLLQVSKKFLMVEPYFNIGTVSANGELASSQGTVFDSSYTTASRSDEDVSGMMYQAGVNMNLLFFRLGAEFGRVLDNDKASLKASFYF